MPRARRPPRQRAAEQRKRDNNPSDVHERQRVDIPDRQNDRATAAKMSGTRDILGREGEGGRREGKDLEEKRSCESYVNITASGISRKEFMVSMKFSSDDPKSAQSILRRYKNKNTETLIHRLAKIREDT